MTIDGWFDDGDRPIIRADLVLPAHDIRLTLPFLVDTGSDRTLLLPSATEKLGVDFEQLADRTYRTTGVGGSMRVARVPARLVFYGSSTYLYDLEVGIAAPGGRRSPVEALLGRDVLERWYLHYDRRIPLLRAENVSADEIRALPDDG